MEWEFEACLTSDNNSLKVNNGINDLALQDSCPLEGVDRQWLLRG